MPRQQRDVDPGESLEKYIGELVRSARLAMGRECTQTVLGGTVYESQTRISKLEMGEEPPDRTLATKLELALNLPQGTLVNLVRVLESDNVLDYAKTFLRKQAIAQMIHAFGLVVPGLLQTPEYVRALLLAGQAGDPREIETYIAQRTERQKVWERPDPPWMNAIIHESVLHAGLGDVKAVYGQLDRLLELQALPHISVRVLPFSAPYVTGSLTILTLPTGMRGAYTEGFLTGAYTEEPEEVMKIQKVYDRLADRSLTDEASTSRIQDALKRFK